MVAARPAASRCGSASARHPGSWAGRTGRRSGRRGGPGRAGGRGPAGRGGPRRARGLLRRGRQPAAVVRPARPLRPGDRTGHHPARARRLRAGLRARSTRLSPRRWPPRCSGPGRAAPLRSCSCTTTTSTSSPSTSAAGLPRRAVISHFVHIPWPGPGRLADAPAADARPAAARPARLRRRRLPHRAVRRATSCSAPRSCSACRSTCDRMSSTVDGREVRARRVPDLGRRRRARARSPPVPRSCAARRGARARTYSPTTTPLVLRVDRTDPSKNIVRGFRAFETAARRPPRARRAGHLPGDPPAEPAGRARVRRLPRRHRRRRRPRSTPGTAGRAGSPIDLRLRRTCRSPSPPTASATCCWSTPSRRHEPRGQGGGRGQPPRRVLALSEATGRARGARPVRR